MSNSILSKEDADKVAVAYHPQKFPMDVPTPAEDFSRLHEAQPSSFRMNEIIQARTGVAERYRREREEMAERKALEKLKELQESAYKEAYALGMDEGRKEAFSKHESEITEGIASLNNLIKSLSVIKMDLLTCNEGHFIKMLYYLASRLAMRDIENNPEAVVPVL